MSSGWTAQEGRFGGTWFVSDSPIHMEVVAPPGVRISFDEEWNPFIPGSLTGWRVLRVQDDGLGDPLSLMDAKPRRASTREVADLLGPQWTHEIKQILRGQLDLAASLVSAREGQPIDDELALAASVAAEWLLEELRSAFPEEPWENPGDCLDYEEIPHYSDELLQLIPEPEEPASREAPAASRGAIFVPAPASSQQDPRIRELMLQVLQVVVLRVRQAIRRMVEDPNLTTHAYGTSPGSAVCGQTPGTCTDTVSGGKDAGVLA